MVYELTFPMENAVKQHSEMHIPSVVEIQISDITYINS